MNLFDGRSKKEINPAGYIGMIFPESEPGKKPAEWAQGQKFDEDKPRMDLLDPWALEGLAKVLTFGAKKYAAHNWRNGISYSRVLAALARHATAISKGEDIDSDSGLPHIDHLGCCWMFLSNFMKTRPDLDDRWKGPNAV